MDTDQKILTLLVDKGIIAKEAADNIRLSALNSGQSLVNILRSKNLITADEFIKVKAEVFRLPYVSLIGRGISPEILTLIPEPVARKYNLIPFELEKETGKLKVAMTDPLDLPVIEFLEQKSDKSIVAFLGKENEILAKIEEEYAAGLSTDVSKAIEETEELPLKTGTTANLEQIIKAAPVAKIVTTILDYAVKSRASDIHFEPQESRTRVRYRIDGILHEKLALPRTVQEAVISRVKILSGMKIDERRIPQDGRFTIKSGNEEVDLRVSSLPTSYGEKIVLRLLKKTGGIPDLPELGLRGLALKSIETAIQRPYGIILVTGPTGSGKTTTLYSLLQRLNTAKVNILTLEDPIEYAVAGVNQVQVNPGAGLTFASGLRSFLRQDPNIMLVGEIRDQETTSLSIQAALTGHLVFSTLHTNNAATAIPRLIDLGAEPFLIVSVLSAVEAQRITRRICPYCKEDYLPVAQVVTDIKNVLGNLLPKDYLSNPPKEIKIYRGKGCKECNNTGYLGRIGIFEAITITPAIGKLILERVPAEQIEKQAVTEGLITMKQDGYLKVLEGIITIEEVLRVAQE